MLKQQITWIKQDKDKTLFIDELNSEGSGVMKSSLRLILEQPLQRNPIPVYKKSQLINELRFLFPNLNVKSKDVITHRKRGNGTVVSFVVYNKEYSAKARVPGRAYLNLLQMVRKDNIKSC